MHWDGQHWQSVLTADDDGAVLRGLAALGPDDVWAVGGRQGSPFVTHWNGATWKAVALPTTAGGSLNAVSGTANDLWAVGAGPDASHVLALRYDGSAWSLRPDAGVSDGGLLTVAALAPDDVWAAGDAVLQQYDGTTWHTVSQTFSGVHEALAADSPSSVWLGGAAGVAHYDGTTSADGHLSGDGLRRQRRRAARGGQRASSTDVWAAGTLTASGAASAPLIVHWDGVAWRPAVDTVESR